MKRVAVFLAVQAMVAGIAWVGGFNFDQRGFWVAYVVLFSVIAGVFAASAFGAPQHDH